MYVDVESGVSVYVDADLGMCDKAGVKVDVYVDGDVYVDIDMDVDRDVDVCVCVWMWLCW